MALKFSDILSPYSDTEIVQRMAKLASFAPHRYDRECRCSDCAEQAFALQTAIQTEGKDNGS